MNKFKNIADKLIKGKLWTSNAKVIQLLQSKDSKNKVIWIDGDSEDLKCVKKDTVRRINENIFENISEFYFSTKSLSNFDLTKKFAIEYNGRRYFVEELIGKGTCSNEDALVKMVVKI